MAMFLVQVRQSGPEFNRSLPLELQSDWRAHADFMDRLVDDGFIVLGGPVGDDYRVAYAIEAASEEVIRAKFALDPWSGSHLVIESIEPWDVKLDGRTG